MNKPVNIRLLVVGNAEPDAESVLQALERGGFAISHGRARTTAELEAALDSDSWDAAICEDSLPSLECPAVLAAIRKRDIDMPLFVLSAAIGAEDAADLMRLGISDIVLKNNLPRLASALRRELRAAGDRCMARNAGERLVETRERLESVASNLPGTVYRRVQRPDGSAYYEYVDPGKFDGLSANLEALSSDAGRLADFIPPDELTRIERAYAQSAETLSRFDEVHKIVFTDGTVRWHRSLATPHCRKNDDIVWDGISLDVTTEMEAKRAFDDERDRVSQIASNIPGHIFRRTLYPDGRIEYSFIGEWLHRLMGLTNEEVERDLNILHERTHPDDRLAREEAYAESARNLTPISLIRRAFAADGSIMWIQTSARPRRLRDGTIVWDGVTLDITDAKAAEETYRQQSRLISSIAGNLPGNVFRRTQHRDGGVSYTLAGFKLSKALGLSQDLVDANPNIFVERTHLEDRVLLDNAYARSARDMSSLDCIRRMIRADGGICWVRTIAQPTRLENGDIVWDGLALDVTAEQVAVQEAKDKQQALDVLADRIPGIIYQRILHPDGTTEIPYASKGLESYTGLTPEEAVADSSLFRSLIHPDDLAKFTEDLMESARTMSLLHHEFRIVDRIGNVHWVQDNGRPRPHGDGGVIWDSAFLDVTAQKEATLALQESQSQLAYIAENLPGLVYQRIQFPDGRVKYKVVGWNISREIGVTPEQIGENSELFFDITHPEDRAALADAYLRSARGMTQLDITRRVLTPSGETLWFRAIARPHEGSDGEVIWNGIGLDVTAEQDAISEAREKQETLDSLAENIPGVIYRRILRQDGSVEYPFLSKGTIDIYGYRPEEITENPEIIRRTTDSNLQDAHDHAIRRSADTLETWNWEGYIRRRDGKQVYVQALGRPRRLDSGDTIWDGFIFDLTDRRQAEEEVERARRYLENVLGHMAQGVITLDEDLRVAHVNKQSQTMLDFPIEPDTAIEDVIRKGADSGVYGDGPQNELTRWRLDAIRRADGRPIERRYANGKSIEVRNMRMPDGGYVLTYTDMTERRAAEQELHDNEERFRRLSEDCDIGILMTGRPTPDNRPELIFCNRAFATLFGYDSVSDIEAMPSRHPLFSEEAGRTIDRLAEERRTGERQRFNVELEGRRRDGSVVWVDMRGTIISWHGQNAALCLFFDITERKLAERELRKLFRAVEQSPDGIVIFNSDFRVEYANPKFAEITGYSWTEVLGQTTTDLFGRLYQMGRPEGLGDALEKGVEWTGEYIGQRPDGNYFWFRETVAPIFGDDGALTHWISIGEDITDFKNVQSDLVHASKLTTLGETAAGLTHELNQPLNVIRMAADACLIMAEDGVDDSKFMLEQFGTISEQTQRMAEIIRHMRIFSRKDEDEVGEMQPLEIVKNSVGLIRDELRLANIELRQDLPETCPPIRGHPVRVEQVLVNLLTNARDAVVANATPADGSDDLTGWIEIAMAYLENVNSIVLSVRDSGGGIPETALPKIFESFFTTKPAGKGTGLGLSVAQTIIRDMGGQISVTNTDDGAEFRITVPALRKPAAKRTDGS